MDKIRELEETIAALEAQRGVLGDALVDATLATLREKLADLRQGQAQEERKLVTVLISDLVESTPLAERLDPEDMSEILDAYLGRWTACIEKHSGVVEKYIGDAVVAVFGLVVAREDDPQRAIASALLMLRELESLNQAFEQTYQICLAMRTAVHTGPVVVSTLVERSGGDFVVVGDTVNLTSRLQGAAPVNGILISHETFLHVQGLFDVKPLGSLTLRGKTQPVRVYQVLGERGRSSHAPRGIQGIRPKLIGRQAEFSRLQQVHEKCSAESRTWLVTVTGDPGIGKTRLAAELESWLENQPGEKIMLKAEASSQRSETPYWLLHSAFSQWCGIMESDAIEIARSKLESWLSPPLERGKGQKNGQMKAHFIGSLLGFDFSASPHLRGVRDDLTQLRKRALRYLGEFFSALAEEAFIYFLLDDIHWSDQPSLEAIQEVARSHPDLRLMVLSLARERLAEVHPEWRTRQLGAPHAALWMRLKPLSRADSRQLFNEIVHKAARMPKTLEDKVLQAAEGNPFYLEEIVKMLLDDRTIQVEEGSGAWLVDSEKMHALHVPATLTAVIQARLDSLPPSKRDTLQLASIIGLSFWDSLLESLAESAASINENLDVLQRRAMIWQKAHSAFEGCREYAFNQSLLRDVVYETVLRKKRKLSHGKIAAWLAEAAQSSGRSGEFSALIAQHNSLAGLPEMAAIWYTRAGRHAHNQGALVEARRFLERACELMPKENQDLRWEALLERDRLLGELGDLQARQADDAALLALAQELGDDHRLATAWRQIATTCNYTGDFTKALQALEAALEAALRCGDGEVEAYVYSFKIACLVPLGEIEQAGRLVEPALEKAEALGDDLELARALTHVGMYYSTIGDLAAATRMDQRMVLICRMIGQQVGEAIGTSNLGFNLLRLGRYGQASEVLERAYDLSRSIGSQRNVAFAGMNRGLAAQFLGKLDIARSRLEESIEQLSAMGDSFGRAVGLSYLARVLEDEGRYELAQASLEEAMQVFQSQGMSSYTADAGACLARCALKQGQVSDAADNASLVWAYLSGNTGQALEFPMEAYLTCAEVFLAGGEAALAQACIQAAHLELQSMAGKISDPQLQDDFIAQAPVHLRIESLWQEMAGAPPTNDPENSRSEKGEMR